MSEIIKVRAKIEDAKIRKISDIWKKKPRGLRFNETDALVVTARGGGRRIVDTFYFCLKPDGTFSVNTLNRDGSRARRARLASFLTYYKITKDVKRFNLAEGVKKLVGKRVDVVPLESGGYIYVP